MREIRTLRAMWRALETGLRKLLNRARKRKRWIQPRRFLRIFAPALDPTPHITQPFDTYDRHEMKMILSA